MHGRPTRALVSLLMFTMSLTAGALPAKADPVSPMSTGNGLVFLEVNTANELVRWTRPISTGDFGRQVAGWGWQNARLITSLDESTFLEVKKDGDLVRWTWDGAAYHAEDVGNGWGTARLIAGISPFTFFEVKTNGQLVMWEFFGNTLRDTVLQSNWGRARLIAGQGFDPDCQCFIFVEVKSDGNLSQWHLRGGVLSETHIGNGWGTARLIAGLQLTVTPPPTFFSFNFMEVKTNGLLSEWIWQTNQLVETNRGNRWGTARLIG